MLTLRQIHLPGFRGVGLYYVLKFFLDAVRDRQFSLLAAAMAFRFFFALFPGLIFLFTLIPYLSIEGLQDRVMDFLASIAPQEGMSLINNIVGEFFKQPDVGLLSFNLVLMLFSALAGIKAMMRAFSKDWGEFRHRNPIRMNIIALFLFLILLALFLFSIALWISGEYLIHYLQEQQLLGSSFEHIMARALHFLIVLFSIFFGLSVTYYLAPSTTTRWKLISPGGILAGILLLLAIFGFKLFFSNFANYNKIYGSLSAVMILMVWFYWMSIVLLIGFELNAAIDLGKHTKKHIKLKQAPDEADLGADPDAELSPTGI